MAGAWKKAFFLNVAQDFSTSIWFAFKLHFGEGLGFLILRHIKKAIDAWILICLLWVWPPETGTTRIVSTFLDSRIPINYTFPLANWQGGPCSMYPSVLQPGLMHLRSKHGFAKPPATVEGEYQAAAKQVFD